MVARDQEEVASADGLEDSLKRGLPMAVPLEFGNDQLLDYDGCCGGANANYDFGTSSGQVLLV